MLELSLKAKKVDFSKVLAMIDGMVPEFDSRVCLEDVPGRERVFDDS